MNVYTAPGKPAIQSDISTREAQLKLQATNPRPGFIRDIAFCTKPSKIQEYYIHQAVQERERPRIESAEFVKLVELFGNAKTSGLKRPRITFNHDVFGKIVLSLAPPTGNNPNFLYVKAYADIYQGKISPMGVFSPAQGCSPELISFVKNFNSDVVEFASEYGRRTGYCCFCASLLEDSRSVALGRGPICSRKFGLPVPY